MRRLILFLHGLGGSSKTSWGRFAELIREDDDLVGFEVDFLEQPSSPWRAWTSPIAAEIGTLADALATELEEFFPQYDQILLVAHSMGGLVVRKWLVRTLMTKSATNVAGIVFFAVPHEGSRVARLLVRLSTDHKQLQQLRPGSPFLTELNEAWIKLGCAEVMPIRNVAAARDACVPPSSAAPIWMGGPPRALADKDHRSVIKPENANDRAFRIVRNAALRMTGTTAPLQPPADAVKGRGGEPVAAPAGNPLFYYYRPEDAPHYLVRLLDGRLAQLLPLRHLWIHGPAGCGKTVAAGRALHNAFGRHLVVSLGAASGTGTAGALASLEGQLAAQFQPAAPASGEQDAVDRVVGLLDECAKAGVGGVLVEEIPLGDAREADAFFAAIRAISVRQAQRASGMPVRIVLTSPVDPGTAFDGNDAGAESVTAVRMPEWSDRELLELLRTVAGTLGLQLGEGVPDRVLRSARGSPRFVKMFLGSLVHLEDADEALAATAAGIAQ